MAFFSLTPWHCLLGGAALGVVSAGKTWLSSRILGISGTMKGILSCDFSKWRWLFLGGMAGGAALVATCMPGAFEAVPATFTIQRAVIGGLLVGAGAALGNGCTSGHGIAGNARLSVRSLVYTVVFMLAGAAATQLTGTMDALQVPKAAPTYVPLGGEELLQGAAIAGVAVLGTAALGLLASALKSKHVSLFYEAFAGVVFSLGLGYTGMIRPSKVASFLAVLHPGWNPSLAFVMGGALLVATPAMFFAKKSKAALDGTAMSLPMSSTIDLPLLLGGVLFGSGWGIVGMCPGPILVALAQPSLPLVVSFVSMLVGLRAGDALKPACQLPPHPKSA